MEKVVWITKSLTFKGGDGSGDKPGHPFRGNQYTDGSGSSSGGSSIPRTSDANRFASERDKSKRSPFLSQTPPDELATKRLFLSDDGSVGYAIDDDGDFGNLFNNGAKGGGKVAIIEGIENGARTLDCFDGFLPDLYSKFGFKVTGRMKFNPEYAPAGWDFDAWDHPDVVFMAYVGGDRSKIREKLKDGKWTSTPYSSKDGEYFDDYDKAKRHSGGLVDDK